MRKYIKRCSCFILLLVLFLSMFTPVSASFEEIHYLSFGLKAFFDTDSHFALLDRSDSAHLHFVKDMRENTIGTLAIKVLSFIYDIGVDESGTEPDETKYMEVLVNIMKTYEMENADAISKQFQMDNLKAIDQLGWDAVKVGIGLLPDISGLGKKAKECGELIKTTMSGLAKVAKNTDELIKVNSKLETLIQDYARFESFLALVESNGRGNLKSAASKLRTCMADAMEIRIKTYCDSAEDHSVDYTQFFFEDVFFTILKQTDLYDKDRGFAEFVAIGTKVNQLWCALNLGKDIGKFVGNIAVGAEDVLNRTLEMKAIYDITQILEDELWFIYHTFISEYTRETDIAAENYITYGNYLISCRIRGEYCLYSMLAKDSGLASRLDDETAIAAETQYNRLTARIAGLKEVLDNIPNVMIVDTGSEMPYEAVNSASTWNVYGADGELYDNYTLRIYNKQSLLNFVRTGPVDEPDPTVTEYTVDSAEPLSIILEYGYAYTFEFVDHDNSDKVKLMNVGVTSVEETVFSVIDVETQFGELATKDEVVLSRNDQYRINVFLSNFSELCFNEYADGTENYGKFEAQSASAEKMIWFVCEHCWVNDQDELFSRWTDAGVYMTIDEINAETERFFGRRVTLEDARNCGYYVDGDRIYYQVGVGEIYDHMTVADSMQKEPDGTYTVNFSIYVVNDQYDTGPGVIADAGVYYLSPEEASEDTGVSFYMSGCAQVRPYINNGKDTYQLISYQVNPNEDETTSSEDTQADMQELPVSVEEIVGKWNVDTEYTMDYNGLGMTNMFGRPYHDSMIFGVDNEFQYWITYYGGEGEYTVNGNRVEYSIQVPDGDVEAGEMRLVSISGTQYLVHQLLGFTVFWKKV